MIEFLPLFAVVLVLVILVWIVRHHLQKRKQQAGHNQRISDALTLIANQTEQKRLKMHQHLETDKDLTLGKLQAHSDYYPAAIVEEIRQIEALWCRLDEHLAEFAEQSTHSTLQSSVLTNRAMKAADEIESLVSKIKLKLEAP